MRLGELRHGVYVQCVRACKKQRVNTELTLLTLDKVSKGLGKDRHGATLRDTPATTIRTNRNH